MSKTKAALIAGGVLFTALAANPVATLIFVFVAGGVLLVAFLFRDKFGLDFSWPDTPQPPTSQPPISPEIRVLVEAEARRLIEAAQHPAVHVDVTTTAPASHVPPWVRPLKSFADRMQEIIGKTCHELTLTKWRKDDPILTPDQAHIYGLIHSAFGRHGNIIKSSLREALCDCKDYLVWSEPAFKISHAADNVFIGSTEAGLRLTDMPYDDGAANRTVQVDLIVYDRTRNVIAAYEVKRGTSHFSSYAQRSGSNNLLAVGALLRSYAEQTKGLRPVKAETHLVSYYGAEQSSKRGDTLSRDDLDRHFGLPIAARIDGATALFRDGLQAILKAGAP